MRYRTGRNIRALELQLQEQESLRSWSGPVSWKGRATTRQNIWFLPVRTPLSIGKCLACGSLMIERSEGFFCSNRDCRLAFWKENRYFDSIGKKMTKQIVEELLNTDKANLRKCRSRKYGKTYDAALFLDTDDRRQAVFRMEFPDRERK